MTETAVAVALAEGSVIAAMPALHYRDFIQEAFITPIRTAVVVDDEFPTLDEFLNDAAAAANKPHAEKAKNIIKFCRDRSPYPWIVDVHDGKNIPIAEEVSGATHFDHTDLLILDYHLNGEHQGGEKAISLLRKLAGNEHFNLAIVYTNNDIGETLREISLSLSSKHRFEEFLGGTGDQYIENKLAAWEEANPSILDDFVRTIDPLAFIKITSSKNITREEVQTSSDLQGFNGLLASLPNSGCISPERLLKYIFRIIYRKNSEGMSCDDFGIIEVDEVPSPSDGHVTNWVRVDSLFVTVIPKSSVEPAQFTDCLVSAIEAWDPSPNRLIVSKMRGEISNRGVVVEKEVLQDPHLQAAWLKEIFNQEMPELRTNVRRNVLRHWESLGSKIEPNILSFAEKIGTFLSRGGVQISRFDRSNALSNPGKVTLHMNSYVCSKAIEGHHLSAGHVLRIGDEGSQEFWVCLTPACDLEPGRNEGTGPNRHLGSWKPFKAAQLIPMSNFQDALNNATRGNHLFLSIDNKDPQAFTFLPDTGAEQSVTPTLRWQQFYAQNQGVFIDAGCTLKVACSHDHEGSLRFEEKKAEVVAHIRYEYALHLLHRLGSHLSRVGLDFIAP